MVAWPAWANRAYNPYNARLATSLEEAGVQVREFRLDRPLSARTDVWHLHWPDVLLDHPSAAVAAGKAVSVLALQSGARRRSARIVWTIHNLAGHDRRHPDLQRWFWGRFTSALDGVLALSATGLHAARERFPALRHTAGFVVPHGHYRDDYPRGLDRPGARRRLGVPAEVPLVLFYGRIREYKCVPELVAAFRRVAGPARLHVAGLPESDRLAQRLRAAAQDDPRITLDLSLLSPEATQTAFAACDVIVLPYREILNSGTALLALSYDRPVLLPDRGAGIDLAAEVGSAWVRTTRDFGPAELAGAVAWSRQPGRPAEAPLESFDWPAVARSTARAYRAVVAGQGGTA